MATPPTEFELRVEHEASRCKHFKGIQHDLCGAGVNVRQIVGGPDFGWGCRIPCIVTRYSRDVAPCANKELPTRAEAEAEIRQQDEIQAKVLRAMDLAHKDAEKRGLKEGNGGLGSIPCPACETGTLSYSVASVNGHMHGICTTKDCVHWME